MSTHVFRNSFNAGELSPLLDARADVAQYGAGCRVMKNVTALPFGGAVSRPGLQYLGAAKHNDSKCRLVPFNFSVTTNFVIEFGKLYFRVWTNGGRVAAVDVATPYLEEHLFQLQFRQINDVVYIVHPSYAPRKITRLADDNWTIELVSWKYPPVRDENIGTTAISSSGTTGNVTLTATSGIFQPGMVGGYFEIGHSRDAAFVDMNLTGNANSGWVAAIGKWDLFTFGIWGGELFLERSMDGGATSEVVRSFKGNKDRNVTTSGTELEQCHLRLRFAWTANTPISGVEPRAIIELAETRYRGFVKITGVAAADSTNADATVERALFSTAPTRHWAEGAWSDYRGWPRAVELHEQRLMFGGCSSQPSTVWGSVSGDYENFQRASNSDGSIAYTIATLEANVIQWLASQEGMVIGTSGEEWLMQAGNSAEPITPTNVQLKRQSRYGSDYIGAIVVNDTLLFLQRGGRKIREFKYAFASDSYEAPDLTLLSEHLLHSGVKQMAFQAHTSAVLWVVTNAGGLAGLTYERDQSVVAWHRHETDGVFESVAVIYGDSPGSDEVWLVVKRLINGAYVRYVERFHPMARTRLEDGDKDGSFYVDCGTDIQGAFASSVASGLNWLEGRQVSILADGAVQRGQTVRGGTVVINPPASRVIIGLPFTAEVQPMRVDLSLTDGTSQGRKQRNNRAVFRLWNTLGLEWWDGREWREISFRSTDDPMGDSPPLFTGDHEAVTGSGCSTSIDLAVRQIDPLPLGLLGIILKLDVYGN